MPGILRIMGGERSQRLEDYLPLYHDPFAKVTKPKNDNLRELICDKLKQINQEVNLVWPGESHHKNKDLQLFWYCYARSINLSANQMRSWAGIKMLDVLSLFLDYNSFYDFINEEFPPQSNCIYVIHMPFSVTEESEFVEDAFLETVLELAQNIGEEIQVLTCDAGGKRDQKRQAKEFLETRGLATSESLVLMGSEFGASQFKLQCHVFNEVWAAHNGSWREVFDLAELKYPDATALKKIQLSIYWCLFNRNFFHRNYEKSNEYLGHAFDLGLDNYEVPFRVGVLHDLLEMTGLARGHYLNLLKFIGVEDAEQQFDQMTFEQPKPDAPDTGSGFYIEGDYVQLDDIKLDCPNFHPKMETMYFEIVRMKLFSKLKQKLTPQAFIRVLDKIVIHTQGEWLIEEYRDLFGEANFEMGTWLMQNPNPAGLVNIKRMLSCFEKAVIYSSDESIHQRCLPILVNYDSLTEVTSQVARMHKNNPAILSLYGLLPSAESTASDPS